MVAHQDAHVAVHGIVPPRDGHVEGIVAGRLLRPAAPLVIRLDQVLLRVRDDEINDGGIAARQARRGSRIKIVLRDGAHERQIHVRVRIDPARHHVLAARIDDLRAGRRFQAGADRHHLVAIGQHIGAESPVRVHHGAATDKYAHKVSGIMVVQRDAARAPPSLSS
jgi:hypothetical protein